MANQRIINKIFKILPIYEEDFESYYKYISRTIIELSGEDKTENLDETIVALKGLKSQCNEITHDDVKRIVMRQVNRLSDKK